MALDPGQFRWMDASKAELVDIIWSAWFSAGNHSRESRWTWNMSTQLLIHYDFKVFHSFWLKFIISSLFAGPFRLHTWNAPPPFFFFFLSFNMLFLHFLLNMKVMLKVLILKSYLFVLWMMLEKVLMYVMFIFVQPLIILYYWYYPIICCKLFLLIFKTCIITLFYSEEIKIWMYFILYTKNKNKNKKTKRKRGILWTAFYKHFLQGCVCVCIYIYIL